MDKNQKVLILGLLAGLYLLSLMLINDKFLTVGATNLAIILLVLTTTDKHILKDHVNHLKTKKALYVIIIGVTLMIIPIFPGETENNKILKDNITHGILLTILIGGIIAPIGEELLYRYLLIDILKRRIGWHIAIAISGVLFAAFHVHGNLYEIIPYFITALIFGYSYMFTKSIFTSMIIHAINNTLGFIIIMMT